MRMTATPVTVCDSMRWMLLTFEEIAYSLYVVTRFSNSVASIPRYVQTTVTTGRSTSGNTSVRALRAESTEWELQVSRAVAKDKDLARTVRKLEEAYDDELLQREGGES